MSIKGTDPKTQGKFIILIAELLKFVESTFPKSTRLDFGALPTNNSVRS